MPDTDRARAILEGLVDRLVDEHPPATTEPRALRGAQYDAGLAWVHFPVGRGGRDLAPRWQRVVDERLAAAGVAPPPPTNALGLYLAAPTLAVHTTDEQADRLLRPLFSGEEVWCQLFSEPGAGSDLAGLATRAVRDGDEWVVNGQKVWNTMAHLADRGMLVARTDPDAPKHRGITYFGLDMHTPGVEVRPLRQITGEAEFNEVYLTDVRVRDVDRIGEVGDGWRVSMTTLMNERVTIGGGSGGGGSGGGGSGGGSSRGRGLIADLMRVWRDRPERHEPALRDRVVRRWCEAEVLRLTNARAAQTRRAGTPGPEGSVSKLLFAETGQRIYETALDVLGADGLLVDGYDFVRPDRVGILGGGDPRTMFLRSRAFSIEGGTSEVMRTILGERVLGLPGEPRTDKHLPWSHVPR